MSMPAEQRRDPGGPESTSCARPTLPSCACRMMPRAKPWRWLQMPEPGFIDASTAHRTHPDWAFGFRRTIEKSGGADRERTVRFQSGLLLHRRHRAARTAGRLRGCCPADYPVTINAVSGYTGGGKQMIAQMEDASRDDAITAALFRLCADAGPQACAGNHHPHRNCRGGRSSRRRLAGLRKACWSMCRCISI
jgi:N-acetyl-gamma-glutamyl-phosphate reductase